MSEAYADAAFTTVLARLLELTSNLGDRTTPAVCAVVRRSPWRFLVCLMQDQDPDRRYGIELPLFGTDGQMANHYCLVNAIRDVHLHRQEYLADERADYLFHEARVVHGDRAVEFGGHPKPVEDSVYSTVRFIGSPLPDLAPPPGAIFMLAGFSYHDLAALRVYLRYLREDIVLGVDLPVSRPQDPGNGIGGGFALAELSSLFREGIPEHVAAHEHPADQYCARLYDLRPWFGDQRT
ncbi:hypothetical protein AB5J62_17640 [Amycolatopsis sp. cg5]|uniref:hypothetical protein n=1 Tax=Amycolatopsis sp. cg5 TaxID=3238802 RepID=UPI0035259789